MRGWCCVLCPTTPPETQTSSMPFDEQKIAASSRPSPSAPRHHILGPCQHPKHPLVAKFLANKCFAHLSVYDAALYIATFENGENPS